jgi:hypothetical protein
MFFDSLKYHIQEAGWQAKKLVRSALAHISSRTSSPVADSNPAASISYSHLRLATARDQLLLRDFAPKATLRVHATEVRHARFPVIDVT